jgi:hypothetical protein
MESKQWWNETIETIGEIMQIRLREWKVDRRTRKRNKFNAIRNNYRQTVPAEKIWFGKPSSLW